MIIALAAIFAVLVAADQVTKVLAADMLKTVGSSALSVSNTARIRAWHGACCRTRRFF